MSATPRTDAVIASDTGDSGFLADLAKLARALETELAAALKERDAAQQKEADMRWLFTEAAESLVALRTAAQEAIANLTLPHGASLTPINDTVAILSKALEEP